MCCQYALEANLLRLASNGIKNTKPYKSENKNSTGDIQLKLDIVSDIIIEKAFKKISSVKEIVSEEKEDIYPLFENGEYLVAYDPLDGSSLIDVNLSVGSIFGIYENDFGTDKMVAACYVVYGPRVEMVFAYNKVNYTYFKMMNSNM